MGGGRHTRARYWFISSMYWFLPMPSSRRPGEGGHSTSRVRQSTGLLSPSLTVGCSEVGQRVVALLEVHHAVHHGAVVVEGRHAQPLDQNILQVVRIELPAERKKEHTR